MSQSNSQHIFVLGLYTRNEAKGRFSIQLPLYIYKLYGERERILRRKQATNSQGKCGGISYRNLGSCIEQLGSTNMVKGRRNTGPAPQRPAPSHQKPSVRDPFPATFSPEFYQLETLKHTSVLNGNEVIPSTRKPWKPSITKESFPGGPKAWDKGPAQKGPAPETMGFSQQKSTRSFIAACCGQVCHIKRVNSHVDHTGD